jgi:hypothetical protein
MTAVEDEDTEPSPRDGSDEPHGITATLAGSSGAGGTAQAPESDEAGSGASGERPDRDEPVVTVEQEEHPAHDWLQWSGLMVSILCGVAVFAALSPDLILADTTATGGDMGAHVWGPAYLRDELLPNLRLTGWTPDWYAGFPAYTFYMVVPSLLIVWLDVGLPLFVGLPLAAGVLYGTWWLWRRSRTHMGAVMIWVAGVFLAVLLVDVNYNVAFKLIAVSGLVTLPVATWVLGRAARVPFPGPPLLAIGATWFLFENGFSILGGNILSTMAGEFAFSISLTFAMLFLAMVFRGMRTGRARAFGAVLFGLTILNHLIPAIFVFVAAIVITFLRREDRTPWWDANRDRRLFAVALVALVGLQLWLVPAGFPITATAVAIAFLVGWDRRAFRYLAVVGPVGFLLAAFWFMPFYLNSAFLNDMGWEKYTNYADYLWPQAEQFDMANRNLWFVLAGIGIVLSLVHRVRLGWFLTMTLVAFAWLFVFLPQYRLWNARLLPFYFLCIFLLAMLGVALVIRAVALVAADVMHRRDEPWWIPVTGTAVVAVVSLVYIAGSLYALPGGTMGTVTAADGTQVSAYRWGPFNFQDPNNADGWAAYNFAGLEGTDANGNYLKSFEEFDAMISMMDGVGEELGCGRVMWEYESELSRFGTPMAPMMLPYFTDGCLGSMEGLYFEASSTTPFHFINQSELSPNPSSAQRDLPYPGFDMEAGIRHLQLMGVRYYLAASPQAVEAARSNPDLTELASTGPFPTPSGEQRDWTVFEVADADPVVPLANLPVVLTPTDDHIDGWVYGERAAATPEVPNPPKGSGPAMDWYLDPSRWDTPLATSGPDDWPRIDRESAAQAPSVPTADPDIEITDYEETNDSISFRVSESGTPVLVKTSYFPNWKASGAEGPYRVSPNFMVVVPTGNEVTLTYGRSATEWLGLLMTLVGIGLTIGLGRADQRREDAEAALAGGQVGGDAGGEVDGPAGESGGVRAGSP